MLLAAGKGEIYIEQYAKWSALFYLYRDSNKSDPVNLNGYSNPRMQIRNAANSNTIIANPTISIIDVANGCLLATLTAVQTGAIQTSGQTYSNVSNYVYDILIDDPSGETVRLFNDYAKVSPGVTR